MPRVSKQVCRKDILNSDGSVRIAKGQTYYKWKFRFGAAHTSLTRPKRSQLTQSGFLATLYDLQDDGISANCKEDLGAELERVKGAVAEMLEECNSSFDNIPEQLQEGHVLNERIQSLEEAESSLDGVDLDDLDEDAKGDEIEEWVQGKIDEIGEILGSIE